jgi:hypothetical protein
MAVSALVSRSFASSSAARTTDDATTTPTPMLVSVSTSPVTPKGVSTSQPSGGSNQDGGHSDGRWSKTTTERAQLIAIGGLMLGALYHIDGVYHRSHLRQLHIAQDKLSTTFSPAKKLKGDYIPRPVAEKSIRAYVGLLPPVQKGSGNTTMTGSEQKGSRDMTTTSSEQTDASPSNYLVVTAPKGSGKTTVIHNALSGRLGVLVVTVEAKDAVPDIEELLVKALGVYDGKVVDGDAAGFIEEVCVRFASKHGGLKPVFVFNIQGDRQDAESTASLSKQLGHMQKTVSSDNDWAYSIGDISSIVVATGMDNDPRAKYINIPGLAEEEALLMLKSYTHHLQQKRVLVNDVVEEIGGNSAALIAVSTDENPRGCMDTMLAVAEAEVEAYIGVHPAHKEALRQLLLKPFGEGMLVAEFERIVRAETKRLNLPAIAADAQSASQTSRVIHKNLQTAHIVVHNFPQYRVGQRLAIAWAEEEAKKWWFQRR